VRIGQLAGALMRRNDLLIGEYRLARVAPVRGAVRLPFVPRAANKNDKTYQRSARSKAPEKYTGKGSGEKPKQYL